VQTSALSRRNSPKRQLRSHRHAYIAGSEGLRQGRRAQAGKGRQPALGRRRAGRLAPVDERGATADAFDAHPSGLCAAAAAPASVPLPPAAGTRVVDRGHSRGEPCLGGAHARRRGEGSRGALRSDAFRAQRSVARRRLQSAYTASRLACCAGLPSPGSTPLRAATGRRPRARRRSATRTAPAARPTSAPSTGRRASCRPSAARGGAGLPRDGSRRRRRRGSRARSGAPGRS
jgi:hypothetical protein